MTSQSIANRQLHTVTLDPDDWESLRATAREMVDDMIDHLRTVRDRPVFRPMIDSSRAFYARRAPQEPTPLDAVYGEFKSHILPYPGGNVHPRYWAWVLGSGTIEGMLAEMLAAAMNPNAGFGGHAAIHLEEQMLRWFCEALGFPPSANGALVGGCSVATLVGLMAARNSMLGTEAMQTGLGSSTQRVVVIGSQATHSSIGRALQVLGLSSKWYAIVGTNDDYSVNLDELERRMDAELTEACTRVVVVGNAGTVNTGAFDDLNALADLCQERGCWLHVDGAFGALVGLHESMKPLIAGIDRADSLAFDLHKWLHVPYEAGVVILREFSKDRLWLPPEGEYLAKIDSAPASGGPDLMQHDVQMSRGFRALKVWFTIRTHGLRRLGETIRDNVDLAEYLRDLIRQDDRLELMADNPLNIACFQYVQPGLSTDELNTLNRRIVESLQNGGIVLPSHTVLHGRFVLRVCITNHRTRVDDLHVLLDEVHRTAESILDRTHRNGIGLNQMTSSADSGCE